MVDRQLLTAINNDFQNDGYLAIDTSSQLSDTEIYKALTGTSVRHFESIDVEVSNKGNCIYI